MNSGSIYANRNGLDINVRIFCFQVKIDHHRLGTEEY